MSKLVAIIFISLLGLAGINHFSFADQNNTSIVYNGLTYEALKVKMMNERHAMVMAQNASRIMEQSQEANKAFIHGYQLANVDASNKWTTEKLREGIVNSGYRIDGTTSYDLKMKEQQKAILSLLNSYLVNGRNSAPAFVECEAWHNCFKPITTKSTWKVGTVIPQDQTISNNTITLKPEFLAHKTGIIANNGTIHNMSELNKWMLENKTR